MHIDAVTRQVEEIANPALQASWDKSGLQVAAMREEIHAIGIFLDPLPGQIGRALDAGCDFLLSHHPLSLKPGLPNRKDNYFFALQKLLRANVPLYAAHTSLDVNLAGPAGWLSRELGLRDLRPLEAEGPQGFGYGAVGDLCEAEPLGLVIDRILKLARLDCANLAGPEPGKLCRRIAWCGGSGGSLVRAAKASGADLYVTGDIKYHDALEAELPVLDVGHHSLEEEMMRRLALVLTEKMPAVNINFFKSASPFRRACQ